MIASRISISNDEKLGLISNFSTMLSAGIPILETVNSLLEDAKGSQKKLLETVKEDLMQGQHLHTSFLKFPKVFDKVTINIIKASEEAGNLETALKDLKDNIKKDMEFMDKVRGALTYPLLIFVVFAAVLLLILIVVVPKISMVFLRLRVELPLPTRILIFVSNLLVSYTILTLLGLLVIGAGIVFLYKTKRKAVIHLFVSLPILSNMAKQIDLRRFSRSLYLLLSSGIPITTALELTEDVVVKPEIASAIYHSKEMVLSGKKLSDGFRDRKTAIPSIVIRIIEAGEKTGTLDKAMQDVSEYLDYEVSKTLQRLTTLLEPVMLVVVGILVGAMMLAIVAPIYGLIGQVGSR